ncbi:MAG: DUF2190 family protein [Candidatus Omnitrophica bacterium]|nr:DUF2190 family protein [Candidatus Omnitrophota bacterium]
MINEGIRTFTANGAITNKARVKLTSASATTPTQVEEAGAGEQHIGIAEYAVGDGELVAIRLRTYPGTHEGIAADTFAVGATLYAAASGNISDTSNGTAIGIALEAATAANDLVEFIDFTVISTTAATISIADAGNFTATATVEAALQEIYQSLVSVQGFVPLSLMAFREAASMAVGNAAANGGLLASDTTPILQPINGATDGCQEIVWAASNNDPIITTIALPPDLDDSADLVLHSRIVSGGTTDAVGFTVDTWFNENDTKVSDTSQTNQTATWAEKITTIAAADVPAGAQTVTISLTPVAHTTDTMAVSAVWLEYKTKIRTS